MQMTIKIPLREVEEAIKAKVSNALPVEYTVKSIKAVTEHDSQAEADYVTGFEMEIEVLGA